MVSRWLVRWICVAVLFVGNDSFQISYTICLIQRKIQVKNNVRVYVYSDDLNHGQHAL